MQSYPVIGIENKETVVMQISNQWFDVLMSGFAL